MSYEFSSTKKVRGAKDHVCEQCRKPIWKGVEHWRNAGKFDGDFYSYREHVECYAAWHELNFDLRDYRDDDGVPFLSDDEQHDPSVREWMIAEYPVVAERLGWRAA